LLDIREDVERRAQGSGITLRGGPAGKPGREQIYRGRENALEMGISLHRGPVENYEGGPFTGNSER